MSVWQIFLLFFLKFGYSDGSSFHQQLHFLGMDCGNSITSHIISGSTRVVRSRIECAAHCLITTGCGTILFDSKIKYRQKSFCTLVTESSPGSPYVLESNSSVCFMKKASVETTHSTPTETTITPTTFPTTLTKTTQATTTPTTTSTKTTTTPTTSTTATTTLTPTTNTSTPATTTTSLTTTTPASTTPTTTTTTLSPTTSATTPTTTTPATTTLKSTTLTQTTPATTTLATTTLTTVTPTTTTQTTTPTTTTTSLTTTPTKTTSTTTTLTPTTTTTPATTTLTTTTTTTIPATTTPATTTLISTTLRPTTLIPTTPTTTTLTTTTTTTIPATTTPTTTTLTSTTLTPTTNATIIPAMTTPTTTTPPTTTPETTTPTTTTLTTTSTTLTTTPTSTTPATTTPATMTTTTMTTITTTPTTMTTTTTTSIGETIIDIIENLDDMCNMNSQYGKAIVTTNGVYLYDDAVSLTTGACRNMTNSELFQGFTSLPDKSTWEGLLTHTNTYIDLFTDAGQVYRWSNKKGVLFPVSGYPKTKQAYVADSVYYTPTNIFSGAHWSVYTQITGGMTLYFFDASTGTIYYHRNQQPHEGSFPISDTTNVDYNGKPLNLWYNLPSNVVGVTAQGNTNRFIVVDVNLNVYFYDIQDPDDVNTSPPVCSLQGQLRL